MTSGSLQRPSAMENREPSGAAATFHAVLLLGGKTATGIEVPPEIVDQLGAGKRPAVRVTISGYTYRTTVAVMGGRFMIPVSADNRRQAGVAAGDEFDVRVEIDLEPREVAVPPDFRAALDNSPDAGRFFNSLSYSRKSRFVLGIEDAKSPETRQRRIDKAISDLAAGKGS
jgi:Bacteriocin-protection, YdeI or OmpD-Associated/Domain of unknown function (DUF1905)